MEKNGEKYKLRKGQVFKKCVDEEMAKAFIEQYVTEKQSTKSLDTKKPNHNREKGITRKSKPF